MNRRAFLQTAGAASLAPFVLTSRKSTAQSSGLDPNLVQACSNSHAMALANMWAGASTPNDWGSVIAAHVNLQAAVQSGNLDPAFSGSVPDSVDPAAFDPGPATQLVQAWQPGFQTSDMLYYYNLLPKDPGSIAGACQSLRSTSLSGHCSAVISNARIMAQAVSAPGGGGGPQFSNLRPQFTAPGNAPKPWNCADDGAAILAVSTVFLVVGLMAGPFGVLAMGFWVGFAVWGGVGAGVWSLGHATVCPF